MNLRDLLNPGDELVTGICWYSADQWARLRRTRGVVLADQAKSLDWRVRRAEFVETASSDVIREVLGRLGTLLRP